MNEEYYDIESVEDIEEPEPSRCPMCDEANYPMGTLGNRRHYQCRACGSQWSFDVAPHNRKE